MSDEAILMITKTKFLESVIFDAKYDENLEFAKAVAHLCYDNLKFTRQVSKKVLNCVHLSTNDTVDRLLLLLLLLLKSIQKKRRENK